ncbi:Hypothetical predicted protein [Podarcis lilfordi]|uniref:Uncharacterized protein n=1 Tax=Podarcis lilfordi TaxID=74358 RepID=A0AA35LN67_9SAUR|nr:Hypothetical predicted protein [Podarcis lilfordi]
MCRCSTDRLKAAASLPGNISPEMAQVGRLHLGSGQVVGLIKIPMASSKLMDLLIVLIGR